MAMLREAVSGLKFDRSRIADHVLTGIKAGMQEAGEGREKVLEHIEKVSRKRENVMDDYYGSLITREEMRRMTARYDAELATWKEKLSSLTDPMAEELNGDRKLHAQITAILSCQTASEAFYKTLLDKITVSKDGSLELRLKSLSQTWMFCLP